MKSSNMSVSCQQNLKNVGEGNNGEEPGRRCQVRDSVWITRGFEAFQRGTMGNAGQNLYVSRAGVLQRIHLFDLNQDGWLDLVLCNSQEHHESPPAYIYSDVFG